MDALNIEYGFNGQFWLTKGFRSFFLKRQLCGVRLENKFRKKAVVVQITTTKMSLHVKNCNEAKNCVTLLHYY